MLRVTKQRIWAAATLLRAAAGLRQGGRLLKVLSMRPSVRWNSLDLWFQPDVALL